MNTKLLNLPPEIRKEIEEFASEVERLHRGEVGDDEFKRFRLQQGIYGQRQADQQMVRTKLPQGRVTSDQLKCLADFADRYSNKILHVTTRQDIQFHFVKIDDVPKGLEDLAEAGLTTREACGNTVRNVTACHKAGTCANEVFDVTPYGRAVTGFLLRHARTQNLPRKFKISLGGCKGCGLALMHDIGLTAQIRKENGAEVRGFRVVVGGGLGSSPHIAELLTEFLPADQLLRMCEAIVSVFDKYGDKKNRNKARFKFVLDKLGIEKIRELYREEFDALEGTGYPPIEVPPSADPHMPAFSPTREFDADPEFKAWVVRNTCEQKQKGFFNIQIKLLLGDMTSAQARLISGIAARFAAGVIVNTVNQNVMIPWVKKEAFGNIFGELRQAELHKAGTEEIRDITCCPGSETCNLGITASRGLAHFLSDEMENGFPQSTDLDHISIKASGCPNSCGQHHIASIGLHGGAKKVNGILTPHYEFFLGGHVSEDEMVFGTPVIKIPAKNTSAAVRKTIETYKNEKQDGETFWQFVDRRGKSYFRELLDEFKNLDDIEKNPLAYLDFGSDQKFTLEDRGQGECAGAVTDMITDYLTAAKRAQFQGKLALEKGALREAVDHARRSVVSSARALLVTEGMDFDLDIECIRKFESLILDMEIVSPQYSELMARFEENVDALDPETTSWWVETSGGLQKECEQVHERMQKDRSLRIRTGGNGHKSQTAIPVAEAAQKIDLLGVKCPFNYVKTKLKLETMESGNLLEVLLDPGDPVTNVPRSLSNDGHEVVSLVEENGHFKLTVKKA